MSIKFNPFTGNLDYVGAAASTTFLPPVDDEVDLPLTDPDGAVRVVKATSRLYVFDLDTTTWYDTGVIAGDFDTTPNPEGVSTDLVTDGNILRPSVSLVAADETNPGGVSTSAQTFGGAKTFADNVMMESDAEVQGTLTLNLAENPAKINASGEVISGQIDLTSEVSGILPIENGGTGNDTYTSNRLAKVGNDGNFATVDEWSVTTVNDATTISGNTGVSVPTDAGNVYHKILRSEVEVNPVNTSSQYNVANIESHLHLDRTGTNNDFNGDVTSISGNISHEGTGNVGSIRTLSAYQTLGAGVGGTGDNATVIDGGVNVAAGYDVTNLALIQMNGQINATATVDFFRVLNFNTNGPAEDYTGMNLNHQGDISQNATVYAASFDGDVTGGLTLYNGNIQNGTATGNITLFNGNNSSETTSFFSGLNINNTGNIGTSFSGANISNSGDVDTGINGYYFSNTGDVTNGGFFAFSANNSGNVSGNVMGLNANLSGTSDSAVGVGINISSATTSYLQGVSVNVGSATCVNNLVYSYQSSGGIVGFNGEISIPDNAGFFTANAVTCQATVENGTPVTNTEVFLNNLACTMLFEDDCGVGAIGLGVSVVSYVGQVAVESGKTVDKVNMALAGLSWPVQSTGGTLTELNMFRAAGAFSAGGTLDLQNIYGFRLDSTFSASATNGFGIYIEDQNAKNWLSGDVKIGGASYSVPDEALDIEGSLKLRGDFKVVATSTEEITIFAPPALAASYSMILPPNMGVAGQVLTTNGSNETSWINIGSTGDLRETSFNLTNNQASPANVTGFAFANATVRSFDALVSVEIDATADLFEEFKIRGIQKGSSWDLNISSTGDDSGIVFSITNAGQIQYISANQAGFVSGKIKFRAITTTVG